MNTKTLLGNTTAESAVLTIFKLRTFGTELLDELVSEEARLDEDRVELLLFDRLDEAELSELDVTVEELLFANEDEETDELRLEDRVELFRELDEICEELLLFKEDEVELDEVRDELLLATLDEAELEELELDEVRDELLFAWLDEVELFSELDAGAEELVFARLEKELEAELSELDATVEELLFADEDEETDELRLEDIDELFSELDEICEELLLFNEDEVELSELTIDEARLEEFELEEIRDELLFARLEEELEIVVVTGVVSEEVLLF